MLCTSIMMCTHIRGVLLLDDVFLRMCTYMGRRDRPEMAITGTIFELFPSICTGKDTNFSASYWHVVAATFEMETSAYLERREGPHVEHAKHFV